ncbi:MAG: MBL fold metallo-hydrolase [Bradymonadaceae bacterium]|nr:MBL fold metallo-hydrolase [Lujinxingiaceae bacterium]
MKVEIIASEISDNFFYLVADEQGVAALIDPIDANSAIALVKEAGYRLKYVVNTHFHPDHIGGNGAVLEAFPSALLVAASGDIEYIDMQMTHAGVRCVEQGLAGGDVLTIGTLVLEVLATPGHTAGHISLLHAQHLFSGDTIFVGGAGHCRMGGDAGVLFRTFRDILRPLPGATRFYPGHDYAVRNAEFVLSIEAEQDEARRVLEEALAAREQRRPMLTDIGRERLYNPFLRFDDPVLLRSLRARHGDLLESARAVSASDDEAVFRCVRELRNNW